MNLKTPTSSSLPATRAKVPVMVIVADPNTRRLHTGCGRTLDELSYWNDYSFEEQKEIIKKSKKRLDPSS